MGCRSSTIFSHCLFGYAWLFTKCIFKTLWNIYFWLFINTIGMLNIWLKQERKEIGWMPLGNMFDVTSGMCLHLLNFKVLWYPNWSCWPFRSKQFILGKIFWTYQIHKRCYFYSHFATSTLFKLSLFDVLLIMVYMPIHPWHSFLLKFCHSTLYVITINSSF